MLTVHFDGLIYMLQAAGGINKYFYNIISRLPADIAPVLTTYQLRDRNLPRQANLQIINYPRFRPSFLCSALRPLYFRFREAASSIDIAHPTYYSLLAGGHARKRKAPLVVTVYDFMLEKFREDLDPTGSNAVIKRNAIMAADALICISESTRRDLLETYPVSDKKIVVTHLASDISPGLCLDQDAVPERPYVLYVGGRAGYKNFTGLLQAFAPVSVRHRDLVLCVVGAPFSEPERRLINELALDQKIVHNGYASDAQLAKLYERCLAFVYPSLYEGFGIPPLEAMSCGAPVIACNSSSIPEVVGNSGLLFDVNAPQQLTEMLAEVVENDSLRERLVELGREQAKLFSWEKTTAQTVELYRSLV